MGLIIKGPPSQGALPTSFPMNFAEPSSGDPPQDGKLKMSEMKAYCKSKSLELPQDRSEQAKKFGPKRLFSLCRLGMKYYLAGA